MTDSHHAAAGNTLLKPGSTGWLRLLLAAGYGLTRRGAVDTAAAAAAVGVSQRTMQRWLVPLKQQPPDTPIAISAARLLILLAPIRPGTAVLDQERRDLAYARDAVVQIARPRGRGVLPAWRDKQWLDPHVVAVVTIAGQSTTGRAHRLVTTARFTSREPVTDWHGMLVDRPILELRRLGPTVDWVVVGSRFAATIVQHSVLTYVTEWRILAPAGRRTRRAATYRWVGARPLPSLRSITVDCGLDPLVSRPAPVPDAAVAERQPPAQARQ